MDFELAQIPQTQPAGTVSAALALPFWTVYYGSTQQTQVHWKETSVGSTEATLLGQPDAINGGYSVYLWGGGNDCTISQVGQIPTGALSLLFKAQFGGPGQQLNVSIGGVSLPIFDVSSGPNYTLYGVNISQFAGKQEDLRFSAPPFTPNGPNYWNIDDIVFSTTAVPEPATPAVLAFGGLLLTLLARRRKN